MSGDRADLAEVIELRSRLPQVVQAASGSEPEPEPEPEPARSAKEDGVRLLARRALSSGELRKELLSVGHPAFEVDSVIDEFVVSLYLDDLGLARAVTESLRDRKGASRSQIRMKLRDRMVSPAAIEEALGELNEDEEFSLLRAAAADRARKMGGLDRQTAERRLLGFLARRGWSGEPASRAVREALDGALPRSGVRFQ
ncbi:regulatory protein RecX [Leucobacter sp. W1478]|uniref:regulatory protein RecX n=1 Tax=Leucobacter sp. W1478 TaxID=3439065 RepID=UPI003F37A411